MPVAHNQFAAKSTEQRTIKQLVCNHGEGRIREKKKQEKIANFPPFMDLNLFPDCRFDNKVWIAKDFATQFAYELDWKVRKRKMFRTQSNINIFILLSLAICVVCSHCTGNCLETTI